MSTIDRLEKLANMSHGYHSGNEPAEGVMTVRVRRSDGSVADAVLCAMGHGGQSVYVKLRHEHGAKHIGTDELLRLNPWLE